LKLSSEELVSKPLLSQLQLVPLHAGGFLERASSLTTLTMRSGGSSRKTKTPPSLSDGGEQLLPLSGGGGGGGSGGGERRRHSHRTPLNMAICIGGVLGSLCVYGVLQVGGWGEGGKGGGFFGALFVTPSIYHQTIPIITSPTSTPFSNPLSASFSLDRTAALVSSHHHDVKSE
jgi:hypothetical protein